MNGEFRRGAQELAAEVARAHEAGPGLPVAEIGLASRRARRRHEATLVAVSGAAVAVLVLGGAAVLDRGGATPPAAPSTPSPSASETTGPSPTPTSEPTGDAEPPTPVVGLVADDLDRLALDPVALSAVVDGLGDLTPVDVPLGDWGLDPAVVIDPSEACRPALTVVADEPSAFRRVGWSSVASSVGQEIVVLPDAEAAASAFASLGASLAGCPEYGASVPGSSGARHVVASLVDDATGLSSYRVAGSEWGEGSTTWWVQVDVLVVNVILRTEVYLFDQGTAAAADADAVADLVEATVQEALAHD